MTVEHSSEKYYSPYAHAYRLGLKVEYVDDLPDSWTGAYHLPARTILLRASGMSAALERSTLAHEIVHAEFGDHGSFAAPTVRAHEIRADRISATRLIHWPHLKRLAASGASLATVAQRLCVTSTVLGLYVRARPALRKIAPEWFDLARSLAPVYGERGRKLRGAISFTELNEASKSLALTASAMTTERKGNGRG